MAIRIVIADDHAVVVKGLQQLFLEESDIEVVAACRSGEEAVDAVRRYRPDVLLLDLKMPGMGGLGAIRELRRTEDETPVVLLTANLDEDELIEAMRHEIRGVVLKEMAPSLLIQCVRKVSAGGKWIEKESVGRAMEKMLRQEKAFTRIRDALTQRELEVLRLLTAGLSNAAIAENLGVSEGTIKSHVHSIYDKVGIRGRVQLILFAKHNNIA